jgi:hypothetical protein
LSGNAYLGDEGVTIANTKVNLKSGDAEESSVISGGDISLSNGATLNVDNVQLWGDTLQVTGSTYHIASGATYLKNDLLLESKAKVTMAGRFILFGNPWVAQNAASLDAETVKNNMPEYSSAILVNGTGTTLNMSGLDTLVIGGSAYIRGSSYSDGSETPVVMGQSIAIKSDQRAYLIPVENLMEYYDDDGKAWGGENPMTGDSYTKWLKAAATSKAAQWEQEKEDGILTTEEIEKGNPYKDGDGNIITSALSQSDLVDFVTKKQTIGALSDFGCTGFSVCAYPTTKGGTVIYLFMQFQDTVIKDDNGKVVLTIPAEANANLYYQAYNTYKDNKDRLNDSLQSYVSGGLTLPENINDTSQMYFTGDLIATDTDENAIVISDSITRPSFTTELNVAYSEQSIYYQDAYSALRKKLVMNYDSLSSTEKEQNIFKNLVDTEKITAGKRYYMSTTGETAVVVKGDYTINGTEETYIRQSVSDEKGNKHTDATLALVVATGDVTVSADFEGMILAGGTIKVAGTTKSITANAYKAALAMCAGSSEDAEETAAQYIRNAGQYLVGGVGNANQTDGKVSFTDYVTYQNWVKQ